MRSRSVPTSRDVPGGNALRPLGLVAEHQQRNAERGRLLLDAAGVAEHQVGIAHPAEQLLDGRTGSSSATPRTLPSRRAHARRRRTHWDEGRSRPRRLAPASSASAAAIDARPSCQLSRRWQVTSRRGRALSRSDRRRQPRHGLEQGIDAAVAGDVDFARYLLRAQGWRRRARSGRTAGRRRHRSRFDIPLPARAATDRGCAGPPRHGPRHSRRETRQRRAERARRVALDDEQVGRGRAAAAAAPRHGGDVGVRILLRRGSREPDRGKSPRPKSRGIEPRVLSGQINVGVRPRAARALATGLSLMASGLVPTTSLMSAERSLPPSSAGGVCLHYGPSSSLAEIVGVGLELEPHRRRRDDVVVEPMLVAVSDRRFLGRRRSCAPAGWCRPIRSSRSAGPAAAAAAARTRAASGRRSPCPTGSSCAPSRKFAQPSSPAAVAKWRPQIKPRPNKVRLSLNCVNAPVLSSDGGGL